MYFSNHFAAALCLFSGALAVPSNIRSRQADQICATGIHVIGTPGAGTADPPYGLLTTLVADILGAIPGSTNTSVPYDHAETDGAAQTSAGAATLTSYLQQYTQSCPNTKIALLGYSAGAVITMNVLCEPLDTVAYSNVVANVVYGDETRTAGAIYNEGTCTGVGEHTRANGPSCDAWASKLQSYCDAEDPLCCATTGTDQAAHYVYANEYDGAASSFVVSQFQNA